MQRGAQLGSAVRTWPGAHGHHEACPEMGRGGPQVWEGELVGTGLTVRLWAGAYMLSRLMYR